MPQRDRTGPQGRGPKTGRGLGRCDTKDVSSVPRNQRGMGLGRGGGRGQGRGRSGGQGR
jgi:hypothetical protein